MGLELYGIDQDEFSGSDLDDNPYYLMDDEEYHYTHGYDNEDNPSSDEEEPMSDSSDESDDSVYDISMDEDRTPRRVIRRREQVLECLECLALILDRRGGGVLIDGELSRLEEKRRDGREKRAKQLLDGSASGSRMNTKGKGKGQAKAKHQSKKPKLSNKSTLPWTRTIKLISSMKADGSAEKDPKELRCCLGILDYLIREQILPLSRDREYIHTLSGLEARIVRSIRNTKLHLPEGFNVIPLDSTLSQHISQTPLFLILRLARYSLRCEFIKPNILDLSNLPYDNINPFIQELHFEDLLDLVGSNLNDVTHLDLSGNKMDNKDLWGPNQSNFPRFQSLISPLPFPNIQVLNLHATPTLRNLPLSMVRLPQLRRIRCDRTSALRWECRFRETSSLYRYHGPIDNVMRFNVEYRRTETNVMSLDKRRGVGVPSLIDFCILSLSLPRFSLTPREDMDSYEKMIGEMIPERYLGLFRGSYRCDRCFRFVVVDQEEKYNRVKALPKEVGWRLHDPRLNYDKKERDRLTLTPVTMLGRCCASCDVQVARTRF
ncbi:hypothetical protein I302_100265 [Kwoniella bestiolae CBS 10118]|uniref:Uncharacterized protein n=1 Tax=Kwoniella bestiolae CBS 10118 TaxID=1296100 RepID=A0A1B9G4N8_9TREE|nr:hypothetical protein I302_03637 [Kwoniella bestiolae CBS 10118]OCF25960.1 hypothetical protein I302_03637 [Kwoniella bestiolae CBS 10118]